jgi:c-di-GMP-related signal transduction protein
LEKFMARQPIFDSARNVYAYELLFRSSAENFFGASQLDVAVASTADNFFLFGLDRLTQGHRAFVNCTRDFLVRDYPTLLPRDRTVIELLETIRIDDQLIAACQRLKDSGYVIALDDFTDAPEWAPLIPLADFIKVDVLATPPEEQVRLAKKFRGANARLLAEKVETYDVFQRTRDRGYTYFQGYFFSRPEMLTRHDIPANKLNYLRVLQAANRPRINLDEIANGIKAEPSLSYRLLRYLNSSAFYFASQVSSIPHALRLLGERDARKWISLVAIACMGEDKPQELIVLPLIRARFCELLAPVARLAGSSNDLFLVGLLSAMDAILDMEMADVLNEIAIAAEIREALLGQTNRLRRIFDIAFMYEMGSWERLEETTQKLGISDEVVSEMFFQSVDWAKGILTGRQSDEPERA